jgi:hypothetical protein
MPSSPNNVPGNDRQRVSGHPGEGDHREVFTAIDIGFGLVDLIFDGDRVIDCRFLEANAQFLRQTGLRPGRTDLARAAARTGWRLDRDVRRDRPDRARNPVRDARGAGRSAL